MARVKHGWQWRRSGVAVAVVGLVAGCTIYQPRDDGSRVPWALARSGAGTAVAAGGPQAVAVPAGERYRVRPGDRLGTLAESHGVSVAELAALNHLRPPYVIRVGQELRIPAGGPGAAPRETMVAQRAGRSAAVAVVDLAPGRPVAKAAEAGAGSRQLAALETAPSTGAAAVLAPAPATPRSKPAKAAIDAPPAEGRNYTVRSGETLSEIAQRLDVGLSELAAANGIKQPYRIRAGQKLRLPGGSYRTTVVDLGSDEPRTVRLATGTPPPLSDGDFLWPVNGKVIGRYGPIDQWRRRDGIDIAARRGAPVLAAQDGIVAYAGNGIRGYGEMILLRHDQGYITTYAHNATLLVEVGDIVRRGQVIARVGDSGDATQSMLHFELRKGRQPIDPQTRLVRDDRTLASAE